MSDKKKNMPDENDWYSGVFTYINDCLASDDRTLVLDTSRPIQDGVGDDADGKFYPCHLYIPNNDRCREGFLRWKAQQKKENANEGD